MIHDLIIAGAQVATASDVFRADIGIRDGRIAALRRDLGEAREMIDATGLYALPGGIDSHVHIAQPSGPGVTMADDFESATRASAFGGNTTIMPFCLPEEGVSLRAAIDAYHARASGNCHINVSFHLIVNRTDPQTCQPALNSPPAIRPAFPSISSFMLPFSEAWTRSAIHIGNTQKIRRSQNQNASSDRHHGATGNGRLS